jgi:uncharacterized protein (TIRG00374 family)
MAKTFSPQQLKKAERWIILLIGATVLVTLVATVIASGRSLATNLVSIPWGGLAWLLVATVVANLLRGWRYQIAAEALHLHVPPLRMLYYYTVGYALTPTPGKVGTAIRLWLLRQYHGLPYRRTTPLLVMDLITDAIANFALASFALLIGGSAHFTGVGIALALALVLGLVGTVIAPHLLGRCVKILYAVSGKRKPRLFARLLQLLNTMSRVFGGKVFLACTLLSLAAWCILGLAMAHLVNGFGQQQLTVAGGALALTLSNIGGFVTMMPAGVGGAEVTMAGLFTLFGIPLGLAVLATALIRIVVLWCTVLVGLAMLPIAMRNAPQPSGSRVDILA